MCVCVMSASWNERRSVNAHNVYSLSSVSFFFFYGCDLRKRNVCVQHENTKNLVKDKKKTKMFSFHRLHSIMGIFNGLMHTGSFLFLLQNFVSIFILIFRTCERT